MKPHLFIKTNNYCILVIIYTSDILYTSDIIYTSDIYIPIILPTQRIFSSEITVYFFWHILFVYFHLLTDILTGHSKRSECVYDSVSHCILWRCCFRRDWSIISIIIVNIINIIVTINIMY